MRIGLDIDGVVYRWSDQAAMLLNQTFNLNLGESTHWNYIKDNTTAEQWKWLWTDVVQNLFGLGNIYPGTTEACNELAELGSISIITNIPRSVVPTRLKWLLSNEVWFDEFRVTSDFNKSKVLPLCDVYIDDSLEVAEDILNNTNAEMIIWDRPWNQDFINHRAYYRVSFWEDVIDIIKRIS